MDPRQVLADLEALRSEHEATEAAHQRALKWLEGARAEAAAGAEALAAERDAHAATVRDKVALEAALAQANEEAAAQQATLEQRRQELEAAGAQLEEANKVRALRISPRPPPPSFSLTPSIPMTHLARIITRQYFQLTMLAAI